MSEQKKYRPSCGTEGLMFFEKYCANCKHDSKEEEPCEIIMYTMFYDIDEPEYPKEWIYQDDKPTCTAHTPQNTTKEKQKNE